MISGQALFHKRSRSRFHFLSSSDDLEYIYVCPRINHNQNRTWIIQLLASSWTIAGPVFRCLAFDKKATLPNLQEQEAYMFEQQNRLSLSLHRGLCNTTRHCVRTQTQARWASEQLPGLSSICLDMYRMSWSRRSASVKEFAGPGSSLGSSTKFALKSLATTC